mgnify:FL=1
MRRRWFLATALLLGAVPTRAAAEDFITLTTRTLLGDPDHLGWSTLRVDFRVQFPAPASGRKFPERRYEIIDAVDRKSERTAFDPGGGTSEWAGLKRLIETAVRPWHHAEA